MKKITIIIALFFAVSFSFTSCKSDKKEVKQEVKKEMATQIYQCPMDCEKGKSYTKPGNCPVCKMELKAKKAGETKAEDHSGHNH